MFIRHMSSLDKGKAIPEASQETKKLRVYAFSYHLRVCSFGAVRIVLVAVVSLGLSTGNYVWNLWVNYESHRQSSLAPSRLTH